jgi:hypothetical protein
MNTIFRHCEQSAAIHLLRHSREYGNPKTFDNIFIIPIGFEGGKFFLKQTGKSINGEPDKCSCRK